MKCKHEPCNNDAKGNGQYCSKSCRAQQSRRNKAGATQVAQQSITLANGSVIAGISIDDISDSALGAVVSLEHYQEHPEMYATRTNPLNINWGKPMTMDQLNRAGLKGNRTPILGDHDYVSCWQPQGIAPQATGQA